MRRNQTVWLLLLAPLLSAIVHDVLAAEPAKTLRAGMIGLDTSHVPAFAKFFNKPKAAGDAAEIKVVVGYPGGTDMPASRDRVGKFTDQLRGMEIEIVQTIPELLAKVDVVMLESVDGRSLHQSQTRSGRHAEAVSLTRDAGESHPGSYACDRARFSLI